MKRRLTASAALLLAAAACYPLRASLPIAVRGTLPDFLWAAAFGCVLYTLTSSRAWAAGGLVVGLLLEVAQLHRAVPGTFDALDVVAIAIGYAAGLTLARVARSNPRAVSSGAAGVQDQHALLVRF